MYVCTYVRVYVRMYVCMYVYMYVCTCVLCTYVCIYVCMYVRTYVRIYVCMCVSMYVCVCVCFYVCTCVRMYVYMYVFMYVRVYVCMYVCVYVFMYVCRFRNVVPCCPTPRLHCFLSFHWPSFGFFSFTALLIPSIQFFCNLCKDKIRDIKWSARWGKITFFYDQRVGFLKTSINLYNATQCQMLLLGNLHTRSHRLYKVKTHKRSAMSTHSTNVTHYLLYC